MIRPREPDGRQTLQLTPLCRRPKWNVAIAHIAPDHGWTADTTTMPPDFFDRCVSLCGTIGLRREHHTGAAS
jgi:hypothetical protein